MAVLVGVSVVAWPAWAKEMPDATFTFSGRSVSAGVGYSWGSGTLTYQGKQYPFSVDELSVDAVGAANATVSGEMYHLKSLDDFNGTYAAGTASATIGEGAGAAAMQNQAGGHRPGHLRLPPEPGPRRSPLHRERHARGETRTRHVAEGLLSIGSWRPRSSGWRRAS